MVDQVIMQKPSKLPLILAVVALLAVGGLGYFVWQLNKNASTPASNATAVPAGQNVADDGAMPAPPAGGVTKPYINDSLAPYGKWVSVDGEQYWQPHVAQEDSAWRPYGTQGNWVYSDSGWVWQSSYNWGWLPFHYGRWLHHPANGWIWLPDTVWGPAWVSWRNSDEAVVWAPLPPAASFEVGVGFHFGGSVGVDFDFGLQAPDFVFVSTEHFCDAGPELSVHFFPPTKVVEVFKTTTIIHNNYTVINNRVSISGPAVAQISRATGREINPRNVETLAVLRPRVVGTVATRAAGTVENAAVREEKAAAHKHEAVVKKPEPAPVKEHAKPEHEKEKGKVKEKERP
ncbi:MAG: DUF6600 domain-containing protein [Planctomycetota bacterium]